MVENLPVGTYDRLSVAYGLAFAPGEIGNALAEETNRDIEEAAEA